MSRIQAVALRITGQTRAALAAYEEQTVLCWCADRGALAHTLGSRAAMLLDTGDIGRATPLISEQEILRRELGDKKAWLADRENGRIDDTEGAGARTDEPFRRHP